LVDVLEDTMTGIDDEHSKEETEACVYKDEFKDAFPSNWKMSEIFVH
jgi:hypothetical protein